MVKSNNSIKGPSDYSGIRMDEYIDMLKSDARPARTAYQRLYDMVISKGYEEVKEYGKKVKSYNFFKDFDEDGNMTADSLFGIDFALERLVKHFAASALNLSNEKRILIMRGPVASAKSTIARQIKRGLEKYSYSEDGRIYSFRWAGLGDNPSNGKVIESDRFGMIRLFDHTCPMFEDPLYLVDKANRKKVFKEISESNKKNKSLMNYNVSHDGELCPKCRFNYNVLFEHYMKETNGDLEKSWLKTMQYVRIFQYRISEADGVGIGTFAPKDEKNQDSTDLTGNINYRLITLLGSESDPRAFNFDGELCKGNRGVVELIELLKLDVAFLYDFLNAQEKVIKPKKQALTYVDTILLGHTNEEEYERLYKNELMRAFRDRAVKIDIPYNMSLKNEVRIYMKDYTVEKMKKEHIAPHVFEVPAMMALLSRLEPMPNAEDEITSKMDKLLLYDGKKPDKQGLDVNLDEFVSSLRDNSVNEGHDGISPRLTQETLALATVDDMSAKCITPFRVVGALEKIIDSKINNPERKKSYLGIMMEKVKEELINRVKNDVREAISGDVEELQNICDKYINNIRYSIDGKKMRHELTNELVPPDEKIMRGIEEKIGVSQERAQEFRKSILQKIGSSSIDGEEFRFDSNDKLRRAFESLLFDEKKEQIDFSRYLVLNTSDEKIKNQFDKIENALVERLDYCNVCAKEALKVAASEFSSEKMEKGK